jgi:NADH:ubiquinone oxidoreductase subunit 3 (subunit A)
LTLALIEVGVFVLILFAALLYLWAKGELRWIKDVVK